LGGIDSTFNPLRAILKKVADVCHVCPRSHA
jgi:hypothetical protein